MTHSRFASPSATIAVLERHGLYTRKAFGQHFLIDDNVIGRIVDLARISTGEHILEIGPGIGTLTDALLAHGAVVTAIERDERLLPVLAGLAAERSGLTVVPGDAVVVPVDRLGRPTALVANLPYAVAATVILRYLEDLDSLDRAVVMVQAEVADRIAAAPGTKAYGAYTVKLALRARVSGRFAVSAACFLPPPRVDSAVIRLDRVARPEPAEVLRAAADAAEAAFSQRRKTLRNAFAAGLGVSAFEALQILDSVGIEGTLRAENLTVDQYVALGREMVRAGVGVES